MISPRSTVTAIPPHFSLGGDAQKIPTSSGWREKTETRPVGTLTHIYQEFLFISSKTSPISLGRLGWLAYTTLW